jgi:hypothetical protein
VAAVESAEKGEVEGRKGAEEEVGEEEEEEERGVVRSGEEG